MRLETIRLSRINIRDERFRTSYFFDAEALARSIVAVGLLCPPLVRASGKRFVLISGWKRVLACRDAGVAEITVLVTEQADDLKLFVAAIEENRTNRSLSLTEKAAILDKLAALGLAQKAIVKDVMPGLGLPATPAHLRSLKKLAGARLDVRRYAHEKEIPFGLLESFLRFGDADRSRLLPLLYPLGQNKQRELLDDLWGVVRRDRVAVKSVLRGGAIGESQRSEALSPLQRADRVRGHLRKLRYPALSTQQEAFDAALRMLGRPGEIVIQPSPFFEDESVSVSFRFKSAGELRDRLKKLERLASQPELRRLFRE
jgi:ParB-like chromosome segregation protein Spo0J